MSDGKGKIGVYARIRPTNEAAGDIRTPGRGLISCHSAHSELEFALDDAFNTSVAQEDIYGVIGRERVARVLDGFDATVLAYGQTGSGKVRAAAP